MLVHSLGAAVSVNSQDNGVLLEAVGNLVQVSLEPDSHALCIDTDVQYSY